LHGGEQALLLFGAVNGVVALAVLQVHAGPVEGDLDVPELVVPGLVGGGVGQGVVVGAVVDDVGKRLLQAVGVVVGPATGLIGDIVQIHVLKVVGALKPYVGAGR
jgi:hypothetical protein